MREFDPDVSHCADVYISEGVSHGADVCVYNPDARSTICERVLFILQITCKNPFVSPVKKMPFVPQIVEDSLF